MKVEIDLEKLIEKTVTIISRELIERHLSACKAERHTERLWTRGNIALVAGIASATAAIVSVAIRLA